MAYCKGFEDAKASKGRKEFPTKSADRLGKDTRVRHRGVGFVFIAVTTSGYHQLSW